MLALIDLTPGLAKLALRRIETLCAIQAQDKDVDEIYFWNYAPVFFDPFLDAGATPEGSRTAPDDLLDRLQEAGNEFVEVDAGFKIPESQRARIDCCQMTVRKEGVAFVAIPKHASFYVETREVPTRVLRRAVGLS